MKIRKLCTIICALGILVTAGTALLSCSDDDNFSAEPQVVNDESETTVRKLDRFSEVEPGFVSFLMQSETRSLDYASNDSLAVFPSRSEWGDEVYEFKDQAGLTAQMVEGKYMDKAAVACVYYVKNENVEVEPTILLMQQVAVNEYVLCDENDTPLIRIVHSDDNNIECTPLTDQKVIQRSLCKAVMNRVGDTVTLIISEWDQDVARDFRTVWSIVTKYACK